jgi:hypothetical protein
MDPVADKVFVAGDRSRLRFDVRHEKPERAVLQRLKAIINAPRM